MVNQKDKKKGPPAASAAKPKETKASQPPKAPQQQKVVPPQQQKKADPPQQPKNVDPPQQQMNIDPPQQEKNVDPPQQQKKIDPPQQQKNVDPPQQKIAASQQQQAKKSPVKQQNGPAEPKTIESVEKTSPPPPQKMDSSSPAVQPAAEAAPAPTAEPAPAAPSTDSAKPTEEGKSKKQLQAERRAKQEADRARKEQAKNAQGGGGASATAKPVRQQAETTISKPKDLATSSDSSRKPAAMADGATVPISEMRRMSLIDSPSQSSAVHPAFVTLKARCDSHQLVHLDAICVEFVAAFKQFISNYNKPVDKAMSRDLDTVIKPQISYITGGLPLPLAIGNLVKQLKQEINSLADDCTEEQGRKLLLEWLDDFVQQKIVLAFEAISLFTRDKLKGALVVLTYSWCPLVQQTLLDAHQNGVTFHVCVLDSQPDQRGKKLLRSLCQANISCSYGLITSIAHLIKQCRLVLLGCSAILSNGYALGTRGSSQVAMVAQAANIPVLLAAPTYKFVDKVQTFTEGHRSSCTALVSERMEMIPADLITAVVTELRILPPSSAPAVLRAKQLVNV